MRDSEEGAHRSPALQFMAVVALVCEILSTDSGITGTLASYAGDSRPIVPLQRLENTSPRKAKPATRAGFMSVLIFRWFADHRKLA
jgi:hypothetical protein